MLSAGAHIISYGFSRISAISFHKGVCFKEPAGLSSVSTSTGSSGNITGVVIVSPGAAAAGKAANVIKKAKAVANNVTPTTRLSE
jgi:hypothetical protein